MKILAAFIAILCSIVPCSAEEWQRADLYFIDWAVLTRVSLTPDRVREQAEYRRSFSQRELYGRYALAKRGLNVA